MLLSFLLISCLAGIFTACDDIEDEYITDTQLSILQESRTSLNYLLKNSTYGTAPGTYPETGKDILNAAIAELDALITRVDVYKRQGKYITSRCRTGNIVDKWTILFPKCRFGNSLATPVYLLWCECRI